MKLAEALLLRSDQQKKIISLKQRINANVLVQDGDQPSEDTNEILKQVFSLIQEFQKLSYAIHETNALTKLNDGSSLLALLTLRDEFVEQHKTLTAAIS
ncbi:DIP1984 family protein, partial [Acinetobacter baumannii]|uniref:DIP1984 family protein n=1 Tax=Acinetobacter baumannii TaxID=470 RepID=UPI00148EF458